MIQNFSLDHVDTVLPEEVSLEVMHFGHGGGWDGIPCINGDTGEPLVYSTPAITSDPRDNELMSASEMVTCGWRNNEVPMGTIIYPDGEKKTKQITVDENGAGILSFAPKLNDPIGIYTFEISNGNIKLESNAYYYKPSVPRLYLITKQQVLFNEFPAGESVWLFMFIEDSYGRWDTEGGVKFVIGDTGKLIVNLPNVPKSIFAAVDSSGIVYDLIDTNGHLVFSDSDDGFVNFRWDEDRYNEFAKRSESYRACKKDAPTSFSFIDRSGGTREVAKIINSEVTLYSQPRYSARIYGKLKVNQALQLVSGPYCFDNAVWWSVLLPYPSPYAGSYSVGNGYIAEVGPHDEHFFEKQDCGDLPSRLSIGENARVAFSTGFDKNIRKQPGFSSLVLTTIPEGTPIQISGIERWCVDGTYWWYITTRDNTAGWMTEMQEGVYLLEPAPK